MPGEGERPKLTPWWPSHLAHRSACGQSTYPLHGASHSMNFLLPSWCLVDTKKELGVPCEVELYFAEPEAFWWIGRRYYFSSSLLLIRIWFQGKSWFASCPRDVFFWSCGLPWSRLQREEALVDTLELCGFSHHIVSYSSPKVWVKFEVLYKMIASQVEEFLLLSQVQQQKFKGSLAYWSMILIFLLLILVWHLGKKWCNNSSTSMFTEISLGIFFVYSILQFPT